MHWMDGIIPAGHAATALLTLLNLYQLIITFFRIQSIILVQAQALKRSSSQVHLEVIPLIPRSSAMMTAAFSPIAIAVL